VNDKPDRDAATESMLRRALMNRSRDAAGDSCLDAETAAAWFERSLTSDEHATIEAHVSGCARCRAMVTLLARTAPPPGPPRRWWQQMPARWLAPAAAAVATATAIWIAVDLRSSVEPIAPAESPAAQRADDAQAKVKEAAPTATTEARGAKPATAPEPERSRSVEESVRQQEKKDASKKPDEQLLRKDRASARTEKLADERSRSKPAAAPGAAADAVAPRPTERAAGGAGALAELAPAAPAPSPARRIDAFAQAGVAGGLIAAEIISPETSSRWRLETSSTVSRSTDGGKSWVSQPIGLSVMLTAGASPSPTVCWMVGRAGVILLTTDGRTWQRVTFPEQVDLRSVSATSAESATVTTADNRTFTTIDGGRTWSPR
jgi:Photosynthesis system II assembly factor YCF48